jgi:hypothetical protein
MYGGRQHRLATVTCVILIALAAYGLSSGPVLAAAFWLRDRTGWDRFYGVMWLYAPLRIAAHGTPAEAWFLFWTDMLGTGFPG